MISQAPVRQPLACRFGIRVKTLYEKGYVNKIHEVSDTGMGKSMSGHIGDQKTRALVLLIAGSDSAGMAGIQQDLRTLHAFDVHAATAITANTAQNHEGVSGIHAVSCEVLQSQMDAITVFDISAIKIGLIASREQVAVVSEVLSKHQGRAAVIFDPVLSSSSGDVLTNNDTFMSDLKEQVLPFCDLLTPNLDEVEALLGLAISTPEQTEQAAKDVLKLGVGAVLIKGGHREGDLCADYFYDGSRSFWLSQPRIDTIHNRGTGCALASSISAALSLGYSLYDAVTIGKMAISQGLRQARSVAGQKGCVSISHFPDQPNDLPHLTAFFPSSNRTSSSPQGFLPCDDSPLGLYPVVDSAHWVERLLRLGVTTIQLRVKDVKGALLETEIKHAIEISQHYNARLFINDYWSLAIKYGAYGVHLGQEDLDDADVKMIRMAGLRLGVSTHSFYETARAHALKPSYIAIGPVYETTTKDMPWIPRGPEGLRYWYSVLKDYPLVAIGGINKERAVDIKAVGVSGIAMITAITLADDPEAVTKELMRVCKD